MSAALKKGDLVRIGNNRKVYRVHVAPHLTPTPITPMPPSGCIGPPTSTCPRRRLATSVGAGIMSAMPNPTYQQALADARRVGAARADDAGQIALLCETAVQSVCGAVAPRLVYEGAMKRGLSGKDFGRLLGNDPQEIERLQWV